MRGGDPLAADKDAPGFVAALGARASAIVFTDLPGSSRGRAPAELQALAASLGLKSEAEPDAKRAFRCGAELAIEANAWLLVTGSLYLVGALRSAVAGAALASTKFGRDKDSSTLSLRKTEAVIGLAGRRMRAPFRAATEGKDQSEKRTLSPKSRVTH